MSTLITGCSGFAGLALAEHLLVAGQEVVGYDLSMPSAAALAVFQGLPGRFSAVQGDVCDEAALRDVMLRYQPRHVVAMAAITADARREIAMPQRIFEVNVGGALAAVSVAAQCGVQRVLYVSSGSAYGASGRAAGRLHEDSSPLMPESLYGMSKRAAEEAVQRLAALHGLPLVVGRLGTCFGPWEADTGVRDTPSAPLQIMRLAQQGRPVVLPRDSKRDWLYVRDAAAAMACLLDATCQHSVYNLAAGYEWSIVQWCEHLAASEPGFAWSMANAETAANIDYYADYDRASMDISRLLADTAFVPSFDLEPALDDFRVWLGCYGNISFERRNTQ